MQARQSSGAAVAAVVANEAENEFAASPLFQARVAVHCRPTAVAFSAGEVEASCPAHELLAIIGPPLSGKTSLINALRGLQRASPITVLVNGTDISIKAFRRMTGFAPREDFPFGFSTAPEAFEFSARLRLPRSFSAADRSEIVADLVASLRLSPSKLAWRMNAFEKKRLVLGVEMSALPRVLIMDEPMANLSTLECVSLLQTLAAFGRASGSSCIFTADRLSSQAFAALTHVLVVSPDHRSLYHGLASDVEVAWAAKGLIMPPKTNPCDFVLDCALSLAPDALPGPNKQALEAKRNADSRANRAGSEEEEEEDRGVGLLTQILILLIRDARGMFRERTQIIARLVAILFIGLFVDLVFQDQADQTRHDYSAGSHFASVALSCMLTSVVSLMLAVRIAGTDLPVFLRERDAEMYLVAPHRIARTLVELPVSFILAIVYVVIVHWAVGWNAKVERIVAPLFLLFEAAVGLGYALVHATGRLGTAEGLVTVLVLPQLFFLGLLVPINSLASWLTWVDNVCFVKYALNIMALSEFNDTLCESPYVCKQWSGLLNQSDIDSSLEGTYYGALLAFAVGGRFVGSIALMWRERRVKERGFLHFD